MKSRVLKYIMLVICMQFFISKLHAQKLSFEPNININTNILYDDEFVMLRKNNKLYYFKRQIDSFFVLHNLNGIDTYFLEMPKNIKLDNLIDFEFFGDNMYLANQSEVFRFIRKSNSHYSYVRSLINNQTKIVRLKDEIFLIKDIYTIEKPNIPNDFIDIYRIDTNMNILDEKHIENFSVRLSNLGANLVDYNSEYILIASYFDSKIYLYNSVLECVDSIKFDVGIKEESLTEITKSLRSFFSNNVKNDLVKLSKSLSTLKWMYKCMFLNDSTILYVNKLGSTEDIVYINLLKLKGENWEQEFVNKPINQLTHQKDTLETYPFNPPLVNSHNIFVINDEIYWSDVYFPYYKIGVNFKQLFRLFEEYYSDERQMTHGILSSKIIYKNE